MTAALNFTPKAFLELTDLAKSGRFGQLDQQGVLFIADRLRRAEVFQLPDSGELLERGKPRPQVDGMTYKPPFPVVALEYQALPKNRPFHPLYEGSKCSRRLALVWECKDAHRDSPFRQPVSGPGVFIVSIAFHDDTGLWIPTGAAGFLPFDCHYATGPLTGAAEAFVQSGRINRKAAESAKLQMELVPFMPEFLGRLRAAVGPDVAGDVVTADLMDEINAYCDLCLALACNNVSTELHRQAPKLQKARLRNGKPPLKDFHVLKIASHDGNGSSALGSHGGVRSHLRRGHIRRLSQTRITWVNACMVRGSLPGFVEKTYTLDQVAS